VSDRSDPRARPWRADLRRSVRLFRTFLVEQTDPARFYGALAEDSVAQLGTYGRLDGALVLDVGAGPGHFRDAFERAGATYLCLDADVGELARRGEGTPRALAGDGTNLPIADASVDVCFSSNVLEHVPDPWRLTDEILRVTRPGGLAFVSYTVWFGPWGGHETSPWHYLGGRRALERFRRAHGHAPKNRYGETLFALSVRAGVRWAGQQSAAEVLAVVPRYHPRWSHWLTRVPVLRELVTWNLLMVLRKK
jgi:SAM-dependent methyltransferase